MVEFDHFRMSEGVTLILCRVIKYKCILPISNYGEFAIIRNQSGLNNFKISVKKFLQVLWNVFKAKEKAATRGFVTA